MANLDIAIRDRANNTTTKAVQFFKDTIPPSIRLYLNGNEVQDQGVLWVKVGDILTLEAEDNESGVAVLRWRIDGGEWKEVDGKGNKKVRVDIKIE